MSTSLWTDVEALQRLARSGRAAEDYSRDSSASAVAAPAVFPTIPRRREFGIHVRELPARVVSGDYCDHFLLAEDTLALVMGDVSGKGVPAALLRGVTRSVLRNLSSSASSPGDTLARVNRILYEANLGSMFVTIFLGWYHIPTGNLLYASAGHPPPFRVDRRGRVVPFGEATGPILGILDLEGYADREKRVNVGDRIVLYTDGVTEARNRAGAFLGPAGFKKILARHAHRPSLRLCEAAVRAVDRFQSGRRQDDATLLILHRRA